jgi:hypothetical protein
MYKNVKHITNTTTANSVDNIELVELNATDIERHPVISTILEIYNPKNMNTNSHTSIKDTNKDCAIIPKHHIIRDIQP